MWTFNKFDYKIKKKRCSQLRIDFKWEVLDHVYNSRRMVSRENVVQYAVGKMRSSIKRSPGGRRWERVGGKD